MKRVILTRTSPRNKESLEKSVSHDMQVSECLKGYDGKWLHFKETGVSGDTPLDKRPVLGDVFEALEKGDELWVWRGDRLTRDYGIEAQIIFMANKKCVTLHSATQPGHYDSNPQAALVRGILASVAKFEVAQLRFRTKNALRRKKEKRERVGHIPYGYRLQGEKWLVPDEKEQAVLNRMQKMYYEEGMTYAEVQESLNKAGILNRSERSWSKSAVYRILQNRELHAKHFQAELENLRQTQ